MKQRILAAGLALALCLGVITAASTAFAFSDVTDTTLSQAVDVLSGMGIVDGYSDGSYHPGDTLTRAQFCKLAVLLEGHGDQAVTSAYRTLFSDLPSSHWAAGYVNLAYTEGLVSGYGNGTFGPDDPVTTAQAVTILLHILGYENADIGPFWPEDYMSRAAKLGLTEGVSAVSGDALTRGDAALMLYAVLGRDTAAGTSFLSAWADSTMDKAVVLDNDAETDDGRTGTAQIYTDGKSASYLEQVRTIPDELVGRRGTLLLDKSGKVTGFVPEENACQTVSVAKLAADGLTDAAGKTYSLDSSLAVLADGEKTTWGERWYDLDGRAAAVLLYNSSGAVDLVVFSESQKYAGTLLTGYYENASPNTTAPTTITLLGHTFQVADGARKTLSQFKVGDQITVSLNGAGEVAAAYDSASRRATLIGVLDEVSGSAAKVSLLNGVEVSGTVASSSAGNLEGTLVKVSSTGVGRLSVTKLSGTTSSKWDVTAGTVGRLTVSNSVKVYDQVAGSAVTEVDLDELVLDVIPADGIAYVGTDATGKVDLIVLNDVTGDCYSYGFLQAGVQTAKSGDAGEETSTTHHTVAVKNSAGTGSAYVVSDSVRQDAAGGLAVTPAGKVAGVVYLTKAEVKRSDFVGDGTVKIDDWYFPVSAGVEVYNADTGLWTGLEVAKAFTDHFTVYYDKAPSDGGQIRLIVAG